MIVDLATLDPAALLDLNNAHAAELSWLDAAALAELLRLSRHARGIGPMRAALIAFHRDSAYDGHHLAWFRRTLPRFVYVDRVVVAAEARGQGLGRLLYEDLFGAAGDVAVACEVNQRPPNPASDAFHARLGFRPVGEGLSRDGSRTVRYLVREPELP